jgi:hypothetical protein
VKNIGKPDAGKLHVRFDEGGQGETCSLLYPQGLRTVRALAGAIWKRSQATRFHEGEFQGDPGSAEAQKRKQLKAVTRPEELHD